MTNAHPNITPPDWFLELSAEHQKPLRDAGVDELSLLADAKKIIDYNKLLRSHVIGETMQWPDELLAIGGDGGGNYFATDPTAPGGQVFVIDHEEEEVVPLAPSIEAFVDWLIQYMSEEALSDE